MGNSPGKVIDDAGKGIAKAGEDAGKGVKKAGEETGKAIEKAGEAVAKGVTEAAKASASALSTASKKAASAGEAAAKTAVEQLAVTADAGEGLIDHAIDATVGETLGPGAADFVKAAARAYITTAFMPPLLEKAIEIGNLLLEGDKIKALLEALHTAMDDVSNNMKTWNDQITQAIKDGKLQKLVKLADGVELYEGNVYSVELNTKIQAFMDAVKPHMVNVVVAGRTKDIGKIKDAANAAKDAFLPASETFLAAVKVWDSLDTDIKSAAGVDFHIPQLEANINNVRSHSV
eukprot:scpid70525/ scgid32278/ 